MMKHPSPMTVQPSARDARWIVAYSRMIVSTPIRTPEGVPGLYFTSWGGNPMIAPLIAPERAWETVGRADYAGFCETAGGSVIVRHRTNT